MKIMDRSEWAIAIAMEVAASGKGNNTWILGQTDIHYKMLDSRAPGQVGLSSLAFGQYKAGDTIDITVIYDEVTVLLLMWDFPRWMHCLWVM